MSNLASDLLFGVAVADALGVPVEFKSPTEINMTSVQSNYQDIPNRFSPFGSWNKPVGTFSDDSSLTFCTAEYVVAGQTDLNDLMDLFKNWLKQGYWTTDGHTFDVGRTTLLAIENFSNDYNWRTAGLNTERDNLVENVIRSVALGRKNYFFAGSNDVAQRAAMAYTFFVNCKKQDVTPYQWLKHVLENIQSINHKNITDLYPHNYKKLITEAVE